MRTNKRRIKQLRKRHRNTQKYNRRKYGGADGEEEAEEKRWNNVIKNLNVANKKRTNTIISQSIQNRGANLVKILQSVCKNPDNCLDLGSYSDTIKRFFNDFIIDKSAISYASTPLKK